MEDYFLSMRVTLKSDMLHDLLITLLVKELVYVNSYGLVIVDETKRNLLLIDSVLQSG